MYSLGLGSAQGSAIPGGVGRSLFPLMWKSDSPHWNGSLGSGSWSGCSFATNFNTQSKMSTPAPALTSAFQPAERRKGYKKDMAFPFMNHFPELVSTTYTYLSCWAYSGGCTWLKAGGEMWALFWCSPLPRIRESQYRGALTVVFGSFVLFPPRSLRGRLRCHCLLTTSCFPGIPLMSKGRKGQASERS